MQVIHPAVRLKLARVATTEEALPGLLKAEACTPFDLAGAPLLRATLYQLGAAEHLLLVNLHHIVADGWSMGVLFDELGRIYTALHEGREPDLTPLPIQYADYAAWERERLQGAPFQQEVAWWRQELAGANGPKLAISRVGTHIPKPCVDRGPSLS